jgi:hypothetical protein
MAHSVLTSGLCGSECSASRPDSKNNPLYPFGLMLCGPGASLIVVEETESPASAAIQIPVVPARSLITVLSRSSLIPGICRI